MAASTSPIDQNLLQSSTFSLAFDRLPFVQFFLQKVNIPGISTMPAIQNTPFIDAPLPADKMQYDRLRMTFQIDEQLWSWTSVNDWLKGITFPENFDQYKNLSRQQRIQMQSKKPQYSDCELVVMSNKNNPVIKFHFNDVFPISLSSINLDTTVSAETILTADAEFGFTNYDYSR